MIANIRGGLGTQLLELMACYALAIENKDVIDRISVNCGGWSDDGAGNVLKDYISEIFVMIRPPIRTTDGQMKMGVFQNQKLLALILKHQKSVRARLGPTKSYAPAPRDPVLHVRRGDYQWVPLETYTDYAKKNRVCLIGNIADDTAKVGHDARVPDISHSPVVDWLAALYAPEVIGTASTFLVSILFMNPDKHVKMFRNQEGSVFTEAMGPLMRKFEPQFPNFRWID